MSRSRPELWLACGVFIVVVAILASPVGAMIIGGGTLSGNLSAPSDDPGWSNVGILAYNRLSAVYLSNGWILTAYHASRPGDRQPWVQFPGDSTEYTLSNWTRIGGADLQVAKLSSIPTGVHDLTIADTAPDNGTFVAAIGYGYKRESPVNKKTWWVDTSTTPYTWYDTQHSGLPTVQGFNYGSAGAENWGYNRINKPSDFASHYDEGYGDTQLLYTVFDKSLLNDSAVGNNVMEVATGDSGGGLFAKNSHGVWQLAGTLVYAYAYSGQPNNTAVYGNPSDVFAGDVSGMVNLNYYHDQILAAMIPEPSSLAMLLGMGATWLVVVWRRGRASRIA